MSLIGHFPVLSICGNCIEYGYLNPNFNDCLLGIIQDINSDILQSGI